MRKIEQTIKDEHPEFKGFVDLGSCVLHAYIMVLVKDLKCMAKTSISYS